MNIDYFLMAKRREALSILLKAGRPIMMTDQLFCEAFPEYRPSEVDMFVNLAMALEGGHMPDIRPTRKEYIAEFCEKNECIYWQGYDMAFPLHYFKPNNDGKNNNHLRNNAVQNSNDSEFHIPGGWIGNTPNSEIQRSGVTGDWSAMDGRIGGESTEKP